jgi:2-dehydropantoate 2-reductase
MGGTRAEPGVVDFTLDAITVIGERDGPISARVEELAARWNASGLAMLAVDDVTPHEWAKQAIQAAVAPLSVLTNLPIHLLWSTPAFASSLAQMIRETAAVAAALGIELSDYEGYGFDVRAAASESHEDATARIMRRGEQLIAAGKTDVVVSMLQDVRAGRRTEIEETVGHVVREGRRLGVPVPTLAFACDVVRGIEAQRLQPLAL